jgi:hypothetical protein
MVELILTFVAWRKGWGWKALIPILLTYFIAFTSGFMIGLTGGSITDYLPAFYIMDAFCIGALIFMIAKPVGMGKLPSYRTLKNLDKPAAAKRAISSYGG